LRFFFSRDWLNVLVPMASSQQKQYGAQVASPRVSRVLQVQCECVLFKLQAFVLQFVNAKANKPNNTLTAAPLFVHALIGDVTHQEHLPRQHPARLVVPRVPSASFATRLPWRLPYPVWLARSVRPRAWLPVYRAQPGRTTH
jgi:hypothetical protein